MEAVILITIAFALLTKVKIKTLDKLADDIFFNDLIEKKIAKFNEAFGSMVYEILTKRDKYATNNDVIFEFNKFKGRIR